MISASRLKTLVIKNKINVIKTQQYIQSNKEQSKAHNELCGSPVIELCPGVYILDALSSIKKL